MVGRRASDWLASEGGRFVLTTITLSVMYLGLQELWLWGGARVARSGWMYGDPVRQYASEAAEIARQSAPREARLAPGYAATVFRLGISYGFWSMELTSIPETDAAAPARARSLQEGRRALMVDARLLGVQGIEPLVSRTRTDRVQLPDRFENDDGGAAGRVEAASSARLRHLFLLGAYSGLTLSLLNRELGIPLSEATARHAILAGVPEPLWRPLTRFRETELPAVRSAYQRDVNALATALAAQP